jgi:hypothetical protein
MLCSPRFWNSIALKWGRLKNHSFRSEEGWHVLWTLAKYIEFQFRLKVTTMANQVQDIREQILRHVKSTHSNFPISETPFSLEIKSKKRFITLYSEPSSNFNFSSHQIQNLLKSHRIEQKFSIPQSFPLPPPGYQCNKDQKAPAQHPNKLPSAANFVIPSIIPLLSRNVPAWPWPRSPTSPPSWCSPP